MSVELNREKRHRFGWIWMPQNSSGAFGEKSALQMRHLLFLLLKTPCPLVQIFALSPPSRSPLRSSCPFCQGSERLRGDAGRRGDAGLRSTAHAWCSRGTPGSVAHACRAHVHAVGAVSDSRAG